jgi:hypothetical protein
MRREYDGNGFLFLLNLNLIDLILQRKIEVLSLGAIYSDFITDNRP